MKYILSHLFEVLAIIEFIIVPVSLIINLKAVKYTVLIINIVLGLTLVMTAQRFADPGFVDVVVTLVGIFVILVAVVQGIIVIKQTTK